MEPEKKADGITIDEEKYSDEIEGFEKISESFLQIIHNLTDSVKSLEKRIKEIESTIIKQEILPNHEKKE